MLGMTQEQQESWCGWSGVNEEGTVGDEVIEIKGWGWQIM